MSRMEKVVMKAIVQVMREIARTSPSIGGRLEAVTRELRAIADE